MRTTKTRLAVGVASVAIVTGLGTPAFAACTVDGSTVTCTADSTAAEVNAAMATVVGDDVTLNVAENANVVQPSTSISPAQQGEVAVSNAGDVGEPAARVDLFYVGTSDQATNTFDLANTGAVSGSVSVFNVGGTTTIDNSGLIGNGLTIGTAGSGAVVVTSTGDIDADGSVGVDIFTGGDIGVTIEGDVGTIASETADSDLKDIQATSLQTATPTPVTTVTTEGTATTTTTTDASGSVDREGGAASVTLAEGGNSGAITANGLESATVTVDGTVGSDTDYQNVFASSSTFEQDRTVVTTVDGADSSSSDTTVRTAVGGAAEIAVGESGSVSGNLSASGLAGATVSVDGSVGSEDATGGAFASSNGFDRTTEFTNSVEGTLTTNTFSQDVTSVGGIASVDVGETGVVTSGVSAGGIGGAEVAIDGSVGLADAPAFANASSTGTASTFAQQSTFDSATGASTFAEQNTSQSNGGDASVSVGETGVLNGSIDANANGDAAVTNAGFIGGNVFAGASGNASASERVFESDGAGSFSDASTSESTSTGGTATIENAAGALIGESATSPIFVSASGDTAARLDNAGRINGSIAVESSGESTTAVEFEAGAASTDATTGVVTTTSTETLAETTTNLGGDAAFSNVAGGLVTGSIDVRGQGSAAVTNEGAVIGTTVAVSSFDDTTFAETEETTSVFVPGADGGTTTSQVTTENFTRSSSGGDVTGMYAGSNGAVQFAPFGGPSDGSVSQFADGDSSAVVSGAIFGDFTGNAGGQDFGYDVTREVDTVLDADGDLRSVDDGYVYTETNRQSDSSSTLAVDGGTITGSASLFATGAASAQLGNGAAIEGSLTVTAQGFGGYDYAETSDSSFLFDEDGNFTGSETLVTRTLQTIVNDGAVSVAIGDASVGGSVSINGAAGTNTFDLAEEGAVGGSVFQSNNANVFASDETESTVGTPTGSVLTIDYAESSTASGGDVTATVAGSIGLGGGDPLEYGDVGFAGGTGLSLFTNAGDASATVTGQVRNGIAIDASGTDTTYAYMQTITDGATTAYSEQRTSTATGGTATLVVDAADTDAPANFGDIFVSGRSGSSVMIGADSTVLAATDGAFMLVGGNYTDTTSTREDTYTGVVLTDQVQTSNSTVVGGASTLVNDGRIGFDGGADFSGDDAFVVVVSPVAATATNNGSIYGSIALSSLHENVSTTVTRTDIDDVTRVDTTDRVYAATGGTATLTNAGLVTGSAGVAAINGVVTNNGVLRGDLTLGNNVDNYTTRSVDTLTQIGEEEVLDLADAIEQGYAVAQNGLLGGTIFVSGTFGQLDDTVRTSNITAALDLNAGSVTGGGVVAEYDEETGERFTSTTVNLNGSGYLGLGDIAITALEDAFGGIDPQIALAGDLSAYAGGARVLGVEALNKTGSGVFLITGADFMPASNTNRLADYTLDIGTFTVSGGEIQLDTATPEGVFGIRGDLVNNAGLVLGSRVTLPAPLFGTNAAVTAIDGVQVYQNGDFSQSGAGTLTVGITPTLVRVVDPAFNSVSFSTNPLAVQQIGLASGLFTTPELAFGQAFTSLGTGFLTLDGNLDLAGTVQLVSPTGGLFTEGQQVDIASVSGTVAATADVAVSGRSNFVTFGLGTRSEGGRTIVFVGAERAGFETVATNQNAAAAGAALSAALPGVVTTIRAGSAGGIGINGNQFVLAQDLANIFVAFDNLVTTDQVAQALDELASGEFYGSLLALSTTAPFVDAITARRLPDGATGFNVWLAPSGDFAELEGDAQVGSFDVDADNYGGSLGFGVATGNGELGIGFGYGRIEAASRGELLEAQADTWMIGAYARQEFGPFAVGAELVYGWSKWDASRVMPLMAREASAEFESDELRGTLHAEYAFDFGGGWAAPFGRLEFRKYNFDGFTEEGAASVNLVVEEADDTVLSPSVGLRAGTSFETDMATLRPELSVSYTFQGDADSFRDVAFLGAPDNGFRLQGIEPDDYLTLGLGIYADIGRHSGAFLRGGYTTGNNIEVASVSAGVTIGF